MRSFFLISNCQAGDYKIIESIMTLASQNIDARHSVCIDLITAFDTQNNSELINCSLRVYEQTPCADCRHKLLKILINTQQANGNLL